MADVIATTVVLLSIALIIVYGSIAFANWAEGPSSPAVLYDATYDDWAVVRHGEVVDHVTTTAEADELLRELEMAA